MPTETIEELQRRLAELTAEERRQAYAELDAIVPTYDWTVHWQSEYVFLVQMRPSAETVAAGEAWRAKWPKYSFSTHMRQAGQMKYVLIDDKLVPVGGGTVLLKGADDTDVFSSEPRLLTIEEVDSLRAGTVPDSLKLI
jgi:hypothetical protein